MITVCTSDADCIAVSTTRSAAPYCAQGVCAEQGNCISDTDCINPANRYWADKKCFGYLECHEAGYCDRVCGGIDTQCKDGSRPVNCIDNDPCDTEPLCPGAVSCRLTSCGECKAVYFNAAGEVIDCNDTSDVTLITPELGVVDVSKLGSAPTASGVRRTTVASALLVAALAAAVAIV